MGGTMLVLNPESLMDDLQKKVAHKIGSFFPFEGKKHTLEVSNLTTEDPKAVDDIPSQTTAKNTGRTWSVAVKGDVVLKDKATGKVLDKVKGIRLASVPGLTRRYSFIVGGSERQVSHLWRLKSGAYSRIAATGNPETQFNLAEGFNRRGFHLILDPKKKTFLLKYESARVPLYSLLKMMGAEDEDIQKAWGAGMLENAKKVSKPMKDGRKLLTSLGDTVPETEEGVTKAIRERFAQTEIREDTTALTLGKPFATVNNEALLVASKKLLGIHRGEVEPDFRDAIQFKSLLGVDDLAADRLDRSKTAIRRKVLNRLDRRDSVRDIIASDVFTKPIHAFFRSSSISNQTQQINPLDWVSRFTETTLVGEGVGGISGPFGVTEDAKAVHSSHLGVLDPVHTPEGERSGITLRLAWGVHKDGQEVKVPMFNTKSKKLDMVSPAKLSKSVVAFPDQYKYKDGNFTPVANAVHAQTPESLKATVDAKDVDYILPSPSMLFSSSTNLVPFLSNDDGTRIEMAARHMEQAIPLKHREAPLVQVQSQTGDNAPTLEKRWAAIAGHVAPVSGTVSSVTKDKIVIKDKTGKNHPVHLYNNFPLNGVSMFLQSEATVSKGDKVTRGAAVADTNYTKDGVLALGKNLRIAYLPYKGLTFEDGVLISETAAKKMTSIHMYKPSVTIDPKESINSRKKYKMLYPAKLTPANEEKLDATGVVKVGETVSPGEILVATAKKAELTPEKALLRGVHKSLVSEYSDKSLTWNSTVEGKVVSVNKIGNDVHVHIRTEEPAKAGDKLSGRHGNKGVISGVLPDDEMPQDKDGNAIEIIHNPQGVGGRMNVGQVLETSISHVAEEEKSPVAIRNFESDRNKRIVKVKGHWRVVNTGKGGEDKKKIWVAPYKYERDYLSVVQDKLKERGLSETEELFDPQTGKSLGQVLTGKQYILKLVHQADKKMAVRSWGPGYEYTLDGEPRGGGKHGAQRMGELGIYGMLAHGAIHNLREMQTFKADSAQDDIWMAVQMGQPLPPPRIPSAFDKFVKYLEALGLGVEREDDTLVIFPFTDKQISNISNGEIKDPGRMLRAKDLRAEKNGLFDEDVTGGIGGRNFGHIALAETFPNPVFERAIKSLLGITQSTYEKLLTGEVGLNKEGKITDEDPVVRGPESIKKLLGQINPKEELKAAVDELNNTEGDQLNKLNKRAKYLRALVRGEVDATVYMLDKQLVLPPKLRPISVLDDGNLSRGDLNQLYREFGLSNQQLKDLPPEMPESQRARLRKEVYDGMRALSGLKEPSPQVKGILNIIAGPQPKSGYFMTKLVKRKQDMTARGIIVPDQTLQLDDVGLPEDVALELFRPFIQQKMVLGGMRPLEARESIIAKSEHAKLAMKEVLKERPVLMKRDPVLHKFGIMAFNVRIMGDKEIHIHPLVTSGFNADFDGDQVALFVPVSKEAVKEAYGLMPSRNLINPASDAIIHTPTMESLVGLYLLSRVKKNSISKKYSSSDALIEDADNGKIPWDTQVGIGKLRTTAGRELLKQKLPKEASALLSNKADWSLNKGGVNKLLQHIATEKPQLYVQTAQVLKDLGFGHVHKVGFSYKLTDFAPLKGIRNKALAAVEPKVRKIQENKNLSKDAKHKAMLKLYEDASAIMEREAMPILKKKDTALYIMSQAGVKPSWTQIEQIILARMLVQDPTGSPATPAVTGSYGDGLSMADYWMSAPGVRRGIIAKTQEVRDPGAITKQLGKSTMDIIISSPDCKTPKGIMLPTTNNSLLDRYTAVSIKLRSGQTIKSNTLITTDTLSKLKASKVTGVVVRSPLKCRVANGVCQKCYGVHAGANAAPMGTNVGIHATQAVGERAAQLTMRVFHTGKGGGIVDAMSRLRQIVQLPKNIPNSAVLARDSGKVTSIKKSPVGGWDVGVGDTQHYVPQNRGLDVKVGSKVTKGQQISHGLINPHELLELTNLPTVQKYLTDEMGKIYDPYGIKRRHMEVIVKALTNTARVQDPGGDDNLLKGDTARISQMEEWNGKRPKGAKPVKYKPILRGTTTLPLDIHDDWLAKMVYARLRDTVQDAAAIRQSSNLHGMHPIPSLVYGKEFGTKPLGEGY